MFPLSKFFSTVYSLALGALLGTGTIIALLYIAGTNGFEKSSEEISFFLPYFWISLITLPFSAKLSHVFGRREGRTD